MNATISGPPAFATLASAIFALLCGGQQANAANLNNHAFSCKEFISRDHIRIVECPVTRSPIASGNTAAFYVDGVVAPPGTAICSMFSTDYNGTPLAWRSFTASDSAFDVYLSFTVAEVPYWAYVDLSCEIYEPNRLLGITALQPEAAANAAASSTPDAELRTSARNAFTAHVAAIASAFDRETRDPQWSSETGALLKSALDTPDMQAIKMKGIDCRTNTCRVEIEYTISQEASTQLQLLSLRTAGTLPAMTAQQLGAASANQSLALYLSREKKL